MHPPHIWSIGAWLIAWLLLRRVPRLPPVQSGGAEEAPPVTIIIPARNEAASLPGLLEDLAVHRPAHAHVIVVDDHSTDETADLARAHDFVTLLEPPPPPSGWTGKVNACWFAAEQAREGTLVFLDADVRLGADALDRVLAAHHRRGGLVSVYPRTVARRPYEHLNSLGSVLSWMITGHGGWFPPRRARTAFGPVLATSREDYFATGGHEAVRAEVVEDFALAGRYSDAGLPVALFGGHAEITSRMYPEGPTALWRGWTKNIASGMLHVPRLRGLGVLFWLVCSIGLFTWVGGIVQEGRLKPIPCALYAAYVVQMGFFFRQVGTSGPGAALLYPLQVAFYALVSLNSVYRTFLVRRLAWRGRAFDRSEPSSVPAHRHGRPGRPV